MQDQQNEGSRGTSMHLNEHHGMPTVFQKTLNKATEGERDVKQKSIAGGQVLEKVIHPNS